MAAFAANRAKIPRKPRQVQGRTTRRAEAECCGSAANRANGPRKPGRCRAARRDARRGESSGFAAKEGRESPLWIDWPTWREMLPKYLGEWVSQ